MKTYCWVYNLRQAQFLLDFGLKVVEIGVGSKGDVYHRFERNAEFERAFSEWRNNSPRYESSDLNSENRCDNPSV